MGNLTARLVHQVFAWYSSVAIKIGRRQGGPSRTGRAHICIDTRLTGNPPRRTAADFGWSALGRIGHRSKAAAGILPRRFVQPVKPRIGASPARTAAIPGTDLVH